MQNLIIRIEFNDGRVEEYLWDDIKSNSRINGDIIAGKWLTELAAHYSLYSYKADGVAIWHYIIMSNFYANIRNLVFDVEVYLELLKEINIESIRSLKFSGDIPEGIVLVTKHFNIVYEQIASNSNLKEPQLLSAAKRLKFLLRAGLVYLRRSYSTYQKIKNNKFNDIDLLIISPSITYRSTDHTGTMQDAMFTNEFLNKLHSSDIKFSYIEFMSEISSSITSLENNRDIIYEEYFRIKYLISKIFKLSFVNQDKKEARLAIEIVRSSIKEVKYKEIDLTETFNKYIGESNVNTEKGFYQYLLAQINPKLTMSLCATNLYTSTISFCQHERGLKSIEYQHGHIANSLANYIPDLYCSDDLKPLPDYYFVWGKYYKDLNSTGFETIYGYPNNYKHENIYVVGNLNIKEFLQSRKDSDKGSIDSLLSFKKPAGKKTVLILLSDNEEKIFITNLLTRIQNDECYEDLQTFFIIKPHPGMIMSQDSFNDDKILVLNKERINLLELLKSIDICVCMSTTVAFEALALGTPLIILKSAFSYILDPIAAGNNVYRCDSYDDFIMLLQNFKPEADNKANIDNNQADYFINTKLIPHDEIINNVKNILYEINSK